MMSALLLGFCFSKLNACNISLFTALLLPWLHSSRPTFKGHLAVHACGACDINFGASVGSSRRGAGGRHINTETLHNHRPPPAGR